ncbi:MAG: hypothetical protein SFY66_02835 [Oculatellaceae cyanobacterium bins.114]|nr:hypothetical protein [Oculatellaceae cyanobacterium bins.114]
MLTQEKAIQRASKRGNKRVLVLGSAVRTPAITAYTWGELPANINVADYDLVILNLVSFLSEQADVGIRPERLPSWQQLARLLFSPGSEVVCIGMPGLEGNSLYQSMMWWLPVTPEFVLESGETIRDVKPEFAGYFEQVRRWFFYATPKFKAHFLGLATYLRVIHPKANNVQVGMGAIAYNRFQQPVGFKLKFRAAWVERGIRALPASTDPSSSNQTAIDSGVAIWLPPPTEMSVDEAINLLLRERYGLIQEQKPPAWADTYRLPHQQAIEDRILTYQQDINHLSQELASARQQLMVASGFSRLLYEQNSESLAQVISSALRELGAQISPLKPPYQDAIQIRDPFNRDGLVVIRARMGVLPLSDLRYLDQWVRDLLMQQDWHGKGVLIANTEFHKPPLQRKEAFQPNCIRAAQHFSYCLVTTTQLFQAIALNQRGELDLTQFWSALLETNGICPLPEISVAE